MVSGWGNLFRNMVSQIKVCHLIIFAGIVAQIPTNLLRLFLIAEWLVAFPGDHCDFGSDHFRYCICAARVAAMCQFCFRDAVLETGCRCRCAAIYP